MRLLIIAVIAFVTAGFAWEYLIKDTNGYIRIHIDPYTMEITIWAFILAAIILFFLGYILFRMLSWILGTKRRLGRWKQDKDEASAGKSMQKGYVDLIEGKWASAEEKLISKIDKSPAPVLNYLAAAQAAQQNGSSERRDAYLNKAYDHDPSSKIAVDLTRARMQYEAGDLDEAQDTLNKLSFHVPKNEQVNRMLLAVNRERGDWNSILKQLPRLKKVASFSEQEVSACEHEACDELLEVANQKNIDEVNTVWASFSRKQKQNTELVNQYAYQLIEAGDHKKAEELIRQKLRKSWDSDLAYTYGLVQGEAPRQLRLAQGWLDKHPQDPDLLLTLGRLAVRCEVWDKARDYYQQAITAGSSQEANRELGQLLESLGESDKALEYYRSGLEHLMPAQTGKADDHIVDVEDPENVVETDDKAPPMVS